MSDVFSIRPIAYISSPFTSKFGIPRQSGLVQTESVIRFEPEYRNPDALRGLESFSHLWLIWAFSQTARETWSPTVRPPRLGGNRRMGVFATRSPYRPNPIGLSCVALAGIETDPEYGTVLRVRGADLLNGTPILDIKPYLPLTDRVPEAVGGFADEVAGDCLSVQDPQNLLSEVPDPIRTALIGLLSQDPRPAYHDSPDRTYSFEFSDLHVSFRVKDGSAVLTELHKK